MNIDSVAAAATELKSTSVKADVAMSVQKQVQDLMKSQAELVIQLIDKSLGIGQAVDAMA